VYFVEAPPGDPGLWTVRGRELVTRAGCIVCDPEVDGAALGLPAERDRVEVADPREETAARAARLVALAGRHAVVVRLWASGALLSGRGTGEALAVSAAGLPFEIVPGIPFGLAAAAYAGIPWARAEPAGTDGASGIVLVSVRDLRRLPGPVWTPERENGPTLVCTTPTSELGAVCEALRASGWAPETPVVCVTSATGSLQRTVSGTLADLPERLGPGGGSEPAVLVAGGTAALGPALAWLERRPLFGRRIVVTRSRAQQPELLAALVERGAEPIEFPTFRVVDAPDPERLRAAARSVHEYDWVVFTSANGVQRLWAAVREWGGDARAFGNTRLAAIGPGTAAALAARGLHADVVPDQYVAEGVLGALEGLGPWTGRRVLLPRAAGARDVLPKGLENWGAQVNEVAAYATEADRGDVERLREELQRGRVDAITFTASSTVRNFVSAVGPEIDGAAVAVIGPITARTARELGLRVEIEAREHTIPGLLDALCEHFRPARTAA
jgi:uroporphyrinogen III methyltransferase/synthase